MAVITSGKTFANGEQLSADKLNQVITAATFNSTDAVDGSTMTLVGGAMAVRDNGITSAKILNSNVTKAKIENVANMKVLGNTSGTAAAPQEVAILDEDNMSTDSNTSLATQQSIKAYVDAQDASTQTSTLNLTIGYNQTYATGTLTANASNQNSTSRPILVIFNLGDNEGVSVSNNGSDFIQVYPGGQDRGPCTIVVPPSGYYRADKSSGTVDVIILS